VEDAKKVMLVRQLGMQEEREQGAGTATGVVSRIAFGDRTCNTTAQSSTCGRSRHSTHSSRGWLAKKGGPEWGWRTWRHGTSKGPKDYGSVWYRTDPWETTSTDGGIGTWSCSAGQDSSSPQGPGQWTGELARWIWARS
jgi:hypothetical protein